MDSITILATSSTLSDVLRALGRTITNTARLRQQWRDSDATLLLLEDQLSSLRTALGQIKQWIEQSATVRPGTFEIHYQFIMDLDRCLACCRLLITKLDADLARLQPTSEGDMPSKFGMMLKTRNLKKTQVMVQQQTSALTLLFTASNSATTAEQKAFLEQPQTRRVFKAMEDDASSLFGRRSVEHHMRSASISSSSSSSTASRLGSLSRRSSKNVSDKQQFVSKIYDRWSRGYQLPEVVDQQAGQNYVETRDKFSTEPVETGEKFVVVGNSPNTVETKEKFSLLPPVIADEKLTVEGSMNTPVETREKFTIDPTESNEKMTVDGDTLGTLESRDRFFDDDQTVIDSLGSLLSPKSTHSSFKEKWKQPLRLISPVREKDDSRKRSIAIDIALKEEKRLGPQHNYKALLLGSDSRANILTAARLRGKTKEFKDQRLDKYREIILEHVRISTQVFIREMREAQIRPDARYLWAYVDILEEYRSDNNNSGSTAAEKLDVRFFSALEAILDDRLVADLLKQSSADSSKEDRPWHESLEHFFGSLHRIAAPDYVPTELDITHVAGSSSTRGAVDNAEVREGDLGLNLVDIGGLGGKKGKWIHQFEEARFVIFVIDLDQCDDKKKMADTMGLLDAMIRSRTFGEASIILLLNVNTPGNPFWSERRTGNENSSVFKSAERVLSRFQQLDLDRLFVSPCDVLMNSAAAIEYVLSAVKEAILVEALVEIVDPK